MVGPLAYGISADPVAVAKVLHEFSRDNAEKFVIKGGAMPNEVMTPQQVADLARMPSREQLLAMLLGTMQAPIAKARPHLNEFRASSCARWRPFRNKRRRRPPEGCLPVSGTT
jgi:large subunit ribosomal protein L10